MFGWFFRKKEVESIKTETKRGFDSVKKDMSAIGEWIKHLDSEKNFQKEEINDIKEVLSSVQDELENIKNIVSILGEVRGIGKYSKLSKQQTAVYSVQTAVQTAVQTPNFDHFSLTERAIIWILLNTDMKLGYDDLAAILGKEKSTIRGQVNSIKQKSSGLIEELIEKKGKKRVFIPEQIKEKMLKNTRKTSKNTKKHQQTAV